MKRSARWMVVAGAALVFVPRGAARAGVATDGTVGPKQTLAGPHFNVLPSLGKQVGGNLFHSFDTFSLAKGETATFTGPDTVKNVLARVTGGEPSSINGTLGCPIPDANVYLINPAGVVFGRHASLDVQGSFAVTTADYLKLGDGGTFHATTPGKSVLTSAAPAAYGFLGKQKLAGISVRGQVDSEPGTFQTTHSPTLEVPTTKFLAAVGGDVSISGGALRAAEGRVDVVTTAAAGEVVLGAPVSTSAAADVGGSVTLVDAALDAGARPRGRQGGVITIRAGAVAAAGSSLAAAGGASEHAETGGAGGRVCVIAGRNVALSANSGVGVGGGNSEGVDGDSQGGAGGAGGRVTISAGGALSMSESFIFGLGGFSDGGTGGAGGRVVVTTGRRISLSLSSINQDGGGGPAAGGAGGRVMVTAGGPASLSLSNISAAGGGGRDIGGAGGRVGVAAGGAVSGGVISADGGGGGAGGGAGGRVAVTAGGGVSSAFISSDGGDGGGAGGRVVVTAGAGISGDFVAAASGGDGGGAGGVVEVTAGGGIHVGILNAAGGLGRGFGTSGGAGGVVSASAGGGVTLSDAALVSAAGGLGAGGAPAVGGRVALAAGRDVALSGSSIVRADGGNAYDISGAAAGAGGGVAVTAGGRVSLTQGSKISADGGDSGNFDFNGGAQGSRNGGAAGGVSIAAGTGVFLSGGSIISANGGGNGGSGGAGGQITVTTVERVEVSGGARLSADNRGPGRGGAAKIVAGELLISDDTTNGAQRTGVQSESTAGVVGGRADLAVAVSAASVVEGLPPRLQLRSPSGTTVSLGFAAFGSRRFADGAVAGSVEPANPFAAFVGQPRGGLWVLEVDNRPDSLASVSPRGVTLSGLSLHLGGTNFDAAAATLTVQPGETTRVGIPVTAPGLVTGTPGRNVGGPAGAIDIDVGRLIIDGPGQISTASLGTGRGGAVNIRARDSVLLTRGATIASRAGGTDPSGNVTLTSGGTIDLRDSTLAAEATGAGGSLALSAGGLFSARGSTLTAQSGGAGGQISIRSVGATLLRDSRIRGRANVLAGLGGDPSAAVGGRDVEVRIDAAGFLSANSIIESNAQATPAVTDVTSQVLTLQSGLATTPPLPDVCGIRLGTANASSFLVIGRGGSPMQPGGYLGDLGAAGLSLTAPARSASEGDPGGG